jgi:hypothetical protein
MMSAATSAIIEPKPNPGVDVDVCDGSGTSVALPVLLGLTDAVAVGEVAGDGVGEVWITLESLIS